MLSETKCLSICNAPTTSKNMTYSLCKLNILKLITGTYATISVPGGAKVNLNIPGGTQPGTVLKITGKGLPNRSGNPGNILVRIVGQTPTGISDADKNAIEQIGKRYS